MWVIEWPKQIKEWLFELAKRISDATLILKAAHDWIHFTWGNMIF